jgi:hypothetical protein
MLNVNENHLSAGQNDTMSGSIRSHRSPRFLSWAISAGLLLGTFAAPASAQWIRTKTLVASAPQADSLYGLEVSVGSSSSLIVAAPLYDIKTANQGGAQAYFPLWGWFPEWSTWDPGLSWNAMYGHAMELDEYRELIISAPGDSTSRGTAFIRFPGGARTELSRNASDKQTYDLYGWSVAKDGDVAVVGAPGDDEGGAGSGAIYIWESPFTSYTKIKGGDAGDGLGDAVAVDGERIAASALGGGDGQIQVYEQKMSGWARIATLENPNPSVQSFGTSIAMSGDIIVVGSETAGSMNAGRVFIYDLSVSKVNPVDELVSPDGGNGDLFGIDVDVDGDTILVGAPLYDIQGKRRRWEDAGTAYFFVESGGGWVLQQQVKAGWIAKGNQFGRSVSLRGCVAVIGAPYTGSEDTGKAYVFECD